MLAFCTRCWLEMQAEAAACPHCGARVDEDPRSYDEKLRAALNHPLAATRARICWLLGKRGDARAIPALLGMLEDEDVYVRIAALSALGKIGDPHVLPILEEAAASPSLIIRLAATQALNTLREHQERDRRQHETR
jgi:HEAT repeat protein